MKKIIFIIILILSMTLNITLLYRGRPEPKIKTIYSKKVRILLPSKGRDLFMRTQNIDVGSPSEKNSKVINLEFDRNGKGYLPTLNTVDASDETVRKIKKVEESVSTDYMYERVYSNTAVEQREQIEKARKDDVGVILILAQDMEIIKESLHKAQVFGIHVIGLSSYEKKYVDQYVGEPYDREYYDSNCKSKNEKGIIYVLTEDTSDFEKKVKTKIKENKYCKDQSNIFIDYNSKTIKSDLDKLLKGSYNKIYVTDFNIASEFMDMYKTIDKAKQIETELGYYNSKILENKSITYEDMYYWEKNYSKISYYSAEAVAHNIFNTPYTVNFVLDKADYFRSGDYGVSVKENKYIYFDKNTKDSKIKYEELKKTKKIIYPRTNVYVEFSELYKDNGILTMPEKIKELYELESKETSIFP